MKSSHPLLLSLAVVCTVPTQGCCENSVCGVLESQNAVRDSGTGDVLISSTDSSVSSVTNEATTIRIAAVQMESKNGDIGGNLERATKLVEKAAEQGAELVLLPELMATGYQFTTEIWDDAEPKKGPTVQWLKANAKRLEIWLGTSFLEAEREDFYNTFVLVDPDGEEAGRVRKYTPAAYEAYFFLGEAGPHVIETELGRIGVGICYENYQCFLKQMMFEESADLILMPHSAPTIAGIPGTSGEFITTHYAEQLGVPVVMVNKIGDWSSPVPPDMTRTLDGRFPGLSAIADSDGNILSMMDDHEGVVVETIHLAPSRRVTEQPQCSGRWILSSLEPFLEYYPAIEEEGLKWYTTSSERKLKALSILPSE